MELEEVGEVRFELREGLLIANCTSRCLGNSALRYFP